MLRSSGHWTTWHNATQPWHCIVEIYFLPTEENGIQHKTLENQAIIEIKKIYTNFWTSHTKKPTMPTMYLHLKCCQKKDFTHKIHKGEAPLFPVTFSKKYTHKYMCEMDAIFYFLPTRKLQRQNNWYHYSTLLTSKTHTFPTNSWVFLYLYKMVVACSNSKWHIHHTQSTIKAL